MIPFFAQDSQKVHPLAHRFPSHPTPCKLLRQPWPSTTVQQLPQPTRQLSMLNFRGRCTTVDLQGALRGASPHPQTGRGEATEKMTRRLTWRTWGEMGVGGQMSQGKNNPHTQERFPKK